VPADLRPAASIAIERDNPAAIARSPIPSSGAIRERPQGAVRHASNTLRFADMTGPRAGRCSTSHQHCIRPEFTCRFRWAAGSLALWDNRCTLHYAINDYDGQRRLLHRTAIAGDGRSRLTGVIVVSHSRFSARSPR